MALLSVQATDRLAETPNPSSASGPRTALVIAAILAIIGLGHVAGTAVAAGLQSWLGHDFATHQTISLLMVGVYQLAFTLFAVRWMQAPAWQTGLGLTWPRLKLWQWAAIVLGLYVVKAMAGIAAISLASVFAGGGALVSGGTPAGLAPVGTLMRSDVWMLMLAGGILAAIVEELIYRGGLSRTLEATRLGWFGGALIASLVWAGLHTYYPLAMQGMLVALGVALSYVRARTGSLYPGMAWHIVNNVVGLLALRAMA